MITVTCYLSKKNVPAAKSRKGENLPDSLFSLINQDYPGFSRDEYVSLEALIPYRRKQLSQLINEEFGEITRIESDVLEAIAHNKILSENIEDDIRDELTIGQKLADKIAEFGGSWTFIISFFSFLATWIGINVWMTVAYGKDKAFDVYPFILLNLILSCLAAIQAPIIMMSQNRQEQKDRIRGEHDYKINLKAELEIKMLHEKIDHLMINQSRRLLEIQDIQADYLEDILKEVKKG